MRLLPYGEHAVLVEAGAGDDLPAIARAAAGVTGAREVVPGARTVLVDFAPARADPATLRDALQARAAAGARTSQATTTVEIPVHYDGADLAAVAAETGLAVDEVVARHAAGAYTVAFCGFAPGFAYLTGLDPALHLPRLERPRTAVPVGAVAIAGPYTAVYPRRSPGGWRLLGRTGLTLFDVTRDPPALLGPGTTVRFVPR